MQCLILGPLRVVDDAGRDRTPRSRQQRAVLTLLAAHAPEPVGVEAIETMLWPDGAPSANALQAIVSKLRKVVEPGRIESDGRSYVLLDVATDLAELDRLVESGIDNEAEALVRGRSLDDLGDDVTALSLRERIDGRIAIARRRRVEAAVSADPVTAAVELRTLVDTEPLVEHWWALLMLAEYRSGRVAEALRTYQRARSLLVEELGVEPGSDLQQLERRMLERDPGLDAPSGASAHPEAATPPIRPGPRLPARMSSFVGRERDLVGLQAALTERRLITLCGPGGAGKTTLALELARRSAPDIARWAELASLSDRDAVVRALGRAAGLPESDQVLPGLTASASDPLERVIDALLDADAVIVVDNCEHLVEIVAEVLHPLLSRCERLTIVATSREPLGVPGEHVYAVPPLPASDAVSLFRQRAADHGVTPDEADHSQVELLCERLDGLPLAIELAAARLRSMTVADLVAGLDDLFALLSRGPRTVEPRQQTLRAVVDWSHDLLDPVDRVVLRRLAAFVGGATAEAARTVCSGPADPEGLVVDPAMVSAAVERLVDKSLVVASRHPTGLRFDLLETIAAYARERLAVAGEREAVMVRHSQVVADLLQPALKGLLGHDQSWWLSTLGVERQNIEAALDTAIARDDAQLAVEITAPLGWYFFMTGELEAGSAMLASALACEGPTDDALRALALGLYGWLTANGPHLERAVAITHEATALLDRVEDPWTHGLVLNVHTMAQFFAGRLDTVTASLPKLNEVAVRSGDPWVAAITKLVTGEILNFRGETAAAMVEFVESAEMFEEVGDRFAFALTTTEASEVFELFGEYDRAVEVLERAIATADEVGFSSHPAAMRARLGNLEILRGNLEVAERHHRTVISDAATARVPWLQAMARYGLSLVERRRGRLDEAAGHLDVAWDLPRTRVVPHLRSLVRGGQGYLADQRGDLHAALACQRDALDTAARLGTPRGTAYALEGCAGALALSELSEVALVGAELLGRADALRRESGGPMPPAERFDLDRAESRLRATLGERFDEAFERGAASDTATMIDAFSDAADTALG